MIPSYFSRDILDMQMQCLVIRIVRWRPIKVANVLFYQQNSGFYSSVNTSKEDTSESDYSCLFCANPPGTVVSRSTGKCSRRTTWLTSFPKSIQIQVAR